MMDILKKSSDDKFRHISIETFKYLAKQVSYISAKNGVKLWDKTKDIETLSYIIDQLDKHLSVMPNDVQHLANDIFGDILEIKQYEDEEPQNEFTAKEIRHILKKISVKLDKLKS